jgi:hypothetical protein
VKEGLSITNIVSPDVAIAMKEKKSDTAAIFLNIQVSFIVRWWLTLSPPADKPRSNFVSPQIARVRSRHRPICWNPLPALVQEEMVARDG